MIFLSIKFHNNGCHNPNRKENPNSFPTRTRYKEHYERDPLSISLFLSPLLSLLPIIRYRAFTPLVQNYERSCGPPLLASVGTGFSCRSVHLSFCPFFYHAYQGKKDIFDEHSTDPKALDPDTDAINNGTPKTVDVPLALDFEFPVALETKEAEPDP